MTGLPASETDFVASAQALNARTFWKLLQDSIWSEPELAIEKLGIVSAVSRDHLSKAIHRQSVADSVHGILEAVPSKWRMEPLKKNLDLVIAGSQKTELPRWIDLAQSTSEQTLADWLIALLGDRLGIKNARRGTTDVFDEMRAVATGVLQRKSMLQQRWQIWARERTLRSSIEPVSMNDIVNPQDIANAMHFVTLAFELNALETSGPLDLLDRKMKSGPEILKSGGTVLGQGIIFRKTTAGPARDWEIKSKQDLVNRIGPAVDLSDVARINALQQLSKLADKISDLNPKEAGIVAQFCLTASDKDAFVAVQQAIPRMSNWLNLTLALVDGIPNSTLEKQTLASLFETILQSPVDIKSENWKQELERIALISINRSLQRTLSQKNRDQEEAWELLAELSLLQYRSRCVSLGMDNRWVRRQSSLLTLQLSFLHAFSHPERSEKERQIAVQKDLRILEALSDHELEKFVIVESRLAHEVLMRSKLAREKKQAYENQLDRILSALQTPGHKLLAIEDFLNSFWLEYSKKDGGTQ